jgi:hypothetical protein
VLCSRLCIFTAIVGYTILLHRIAHARLPPRTHNCSSLFNMWPHRALRPTLSPMQKSSSDPSPAFLRVDTRSKVSRNPVGSKGVKGQRLRLVGE